MSQMQFHESSAIAPVLFLAGHAGDAVLAVITAIEGPSYRPLGAMMALTPEGERVGSLSSGCVEADIALHANEALNEGTLRVIRYGRGSPFVDIELPCGGGLEITLIPRPGRPVLQTIGQACHDRTPISLVVDLKTGSLQTQATGDTGVQSEAFIVRFDPEIHFFVFGKGPEASTFALLAQSAGFGITLLSPDQETLELAQQAGIETRHLKSAKVPADIEPDAHSAALLFFHDHDWEPAILSQLVTSEAFYIGAQGSQRAAEARRAALFALGLTDQDCARIRGPIGLIPSARDARKLAVSVLAEVMNMR